MRNGSTSQNITSSSHKWMIIALAVAGISVLISNQFGSETNELTFTVISAISLGVLVAASVRIVLVAKFKQDRMIGLIFATYATLWFIGEQIWNIYYGLLLNMDQFPSIADAFYLTGFVPLTAFLLLILKPHRNFISKKIFFTSIALAFSFLIPSILLTTTINYSTIDLVVALLYPIADAIILVPLIVGFVIFYGVKQNYLRFILVALIIEVATDTGFLFLEINDAYYAGHPIWLGFEWANILIAYGAYKQSTVMKNMNVSIMEQLTKEIKQSIDDRGIFVLTPLMISVAIMILAFSLIQIYDYEHMSTSELAIFEPLVYGGIIATTITIALIFVIAKKISAMRTRISEVSNIIKQTKDDTSVSELSGQVVTFEKKLIKIENVGKYFAKTIIVIGVILSLVLGYYVYINYVEQRVEKTIPTAQFIVENLKGDTVTTWVAWQLAEDEVMHISVINSDLVSSDKIDAIRDAILSEETIDIQNSEIGKEPADLVSTYYVGWKGALQKASEDHPRINIPTNLQVELSDKPVGEVVIVLTNLSDPDGTLGFTKSIADDQQNQILKSTITIFDVENLDSHELATIIRHEFGHSLGLGHATAKEDLMYPKLSSPHTYISECDVDAITSLYDKKGSLAVICEN